MSTKKDIQAIAWGKTKQILVPSGRRFILREQNGDDDDILSNPSTGADGSNIDYYIAGIVVKEIINDKEVTFSLEQAKSLLKKDMIAIIFESRIHNLGNILKFKFDFGDDPVVGKGIIGYEEELSQYLHDYTKPFPLTEEDEGYFKFKIPPYPESAYGKFEMTTDSGKRVRINLMNREGMKFILGTKDEETTKNTELKARNLELFTENNWLKVENFSPFSPRDMVNIIAWVKEIDPDYNAITEIAHPVTKYKLNYTLTNSTDFFYPVEI